MAKEHPDGIDEVLQVLTEKDKPRRTVCGCLVLLGAMLCLPLILTIWVVFAEWTAQAGVWAVLGAAVAFVAFAFGIFGIAYLLAGSGGMEED